MTVTPTETIAPNNPYLKSLFQGKRIALETSFQSQKELIRYLILGTATGILLYVYLGPTAYGLKAIFLTIGFICFALTLFFGLRAMLRLTEAYQSYAHQWATHDDLILKSLLASEGANHEGGQIGGKTNKAPHQSPILDFTRYQGNLNAAFWWATGGVLSGILLLLQPNNRALWGSVQRYMEALVGG